MMPLAGFTGNGRLLIMYTLHLETARVIAVSAVHVGRQTGPDARSTELQLCPPCRVQGRSLLQVAVREGC